MPQQYREGVGGKVVGRYAFPALDLDWSRGMMRDTSRVDEPQSALWDAVDFLVDQAGLLRMRGNWSYAGPAMTSATYASGVAYANFSAGGKLVAIGDNNHLYTVTSGATTDISTLGAAYVPIQPPIFRAGGTDLLVFTANDGTTAPKTYNGTAVAALGGTPAAGKFGCVYKSRLVLGNTAANPNRVFFSPTPDITTAWDTTNSWIDADHTLTGLAAVNNVLLLFSAGHLERIVGATPPPGSDMDRSPLASIGCSDARSIATKDNTVMFANPGGVYLTNGAGLQDLTKNHGIKSLWRSSLNGYAPTTWTIAAGVYQDYYVVTVLNASGAEVITLLFDIPRNTVVRAQNMAANMYATAYGTTENFYFSSRATNRVGALANIFVGGGGTDDNSSGPSPAATLKSVPSTPWLKHFRDGRITYQLTNSGATPLLSVSPSRNIADTGTGTSVTFAANTLPGRGRFSMSYVGQAVGLTLSVTNRAGNLVIYGVELDQRPISLTAGGVGT